MIINNAASRRDVDFWTKHLQNTEQNERAELKEIRGLSSATLGEALEEMRQLARDNPRVENFMYHADFNPCPHEHLTAEQRDRAFEIFEQQRGIPADAARVVMEHVKNGRQHWHVIWYRLNEQGRPFSDRLDAKVAHTAARKIEWELGLEKVISPLTREPGTPRPPRAPEPWEMYRGMQSGIDPRDITAEVTELRQQSDTGRAFQAALEQHGYQLVTGDRGLLILDSAGKEHSLARRSGMKAKELNEFMRDVDRAALPTLEQGKELYQERKIAALEADRETVRHEIEWEEKLAQAAIEKEKIERRFIAPEDRQRETRAGGPQQERTAREWPIQPPQPEPIKSSPCYHFEDAAREAGQPLPGEQQTPQPRSGDRRIQKAEHEAMLDERTKEGAIQPNAKAFAEELERHGLAFARATADEAQRSHREAEFAKAIGNYAPRFKEEEIVAVTEPGLQYNRDGQWTEPPRVHKLDPANAEKYLALLSLDKKQLQGIDATKSMLDARAEQRAAQWEAIRLERATDTNESPTSGLRPQDKAAQTVLWAATKTGQQVVAKGKMAFRAIGGAGKAFDVVSSIFESILAPKLTPEQIREGEIATHRRSAEADNNAEFSNHMAQLAQERQNQQEQQAARDRQREIERDR